MLTIPNLHADFWSEPDRGCMVTLAVHAVFSLGSRVATLAPGWGGAAGVFAQLVAPVPHKNHGDVLLVGSAYAPARAPRFVARLKVGDLQFGVALATQGRDRVALPAEHGPASAVGESRWNEERRWSLERDTECFQLAPSRQRIERLTTPMLIELEHLHPKHRRHTIELPSIVPEAFVVVNGAQRDVAMHCDTLCINSDQQQILIVWRGHLPIDEPSQLGRAGHCLKQGNTVIRPQEQIQIGAAAGLPFSRRRTQARTAELPTVEELIGTAKLPPPPRPHPPQTPPPTPPPPTPPPPPPPPPPPRPRVTGSMPPSSSPPPFVQSAPPPHSSEHDSLEKPSWHPPPAPFAASPTAAAPSAVPESPWRTSDTPRGKMGSIVPPNPARELIEQRTSPDIEQAEDDPVSSPTLERAGETIGPVEVVWYSDEAADLVRKDEVLAELLPTPPEPEPPPKPRRGEAPPPPTQPDPAAEADRARHDVAIVLGEAASTDLNELDALLAEALSNEARRPPLVVINGTLTLRFDDTQALTLACALAKPVASRDVPLAEAIALASEVSAGASPSPSMVRNLRGRVEKAWRQGNRDFPADYVEDGVRRALLDNRAYHELTLFGGCFIVGTLPRGKGTLPAYLPKAVADHLPLYTSFDVRVIAKAVPRQDEAEGQPVALSVVALGRRVNLVAP